MRIRDWRVAFVFLVVCGIAESSFSAGQCSSPLVPHSDSSDQREFQNAYQCLSDISPGRIRQVIYSSSTASFSTTNSSYQTTNLTGSITPISSTSKILVIAMGAIDQPGGQVASISIFRGATNLFSSSGGFSGSIAGSGRFDQTVTLTAMDSPGTTSATVYSVGLKTNGGTAAYGSLSGETQTMILVEIGS